MKSSASEPGLSVVKRLKNAALKFLSHFSLMRTYSILLIYLPQPTEQTNLKQQFCIQGAVYFILSGDLN